MHGFHDIMDMINQARTCYDCGVRLKFGEIRRCKKCKEIYKKKKKDNKQK